MSESAELNRILKDLAEGRIAADEAAALIDALPKEPPALVLDPESLYDAPPARVLPDPAPDAATAPDAEVTPEPTVADNSTDEQHWASPDPETLVVEEPSDESVDADEPSVTGDEPQGAADTGTKPGPNDPEVVFSFQIDDVAATAGEVLKDAGDFAKHAWQRIGAFATSVVTPEEHAAPAAATGEAENPEQPARPAGSRGIERLVLRSVGRRVRLVGDPRVATIAVDGPHTLRRQGVTLEVSTEGELGLNLDGFSVVRPPRTVEDLRVLGFGRELVVRVNPAIPVDAEVTGARLTTLDVPFLGKIRVSAGGANLNGVSQIVDALIQAGGASLAGPLSAGRSRVRVESGNLTLQLTQDANLTIRSETQLGRISWPGEPHGELDEFVVGNGSAHLELGVVMGRAVVRIQG